MRLGLLLPTLTDNPLGRRWLRFVLNQLELENITPFLVGSADQLSAPNYSVRYSNFITGLISSVFSAGNSLKLWRLRSRGYSDPFWRLAGEILPGPNLERLGEPAPGNAGTTPPSVNGSEVLSADSPLLWPVRSEQAETCLEALRLVVQPPLRLEQLREILALLESLGDNLNVRVPRWLFEEFELPAEVFTAETLAEYRKVDCDLVWAWGYSPALHLRVLDWLNTSAVIGPNVAPWTRLVAEGNESLLYPSGGPEFGVEVVDRLHKRKAEREELIAANARGRSRKFPAESRVKKQLKKFLGLA